MFTKNRLHIFIALFVAATVVYGGTGINVYSFCCNNCKIDTVLPLTQEKGCCGIEHKPSAHHEHNGKKDCCANKMVSKAEKEVLPSSTDSGCKVERISVDWKISQSEQLITPLIPLVLFAFNPIEWRYNVIEFPILRQYYTDTQPPPNISGQTYFNLLNTLII